MNTPARLSHSPDLDANQSMFSKGGESISFHGLVSNTHRKLGTAGNNSLAVLPEGDSEPRSRDMSSDRSSDVQQRIRSTHQALNGLVEV